MDDDGKGNGLGIALAQINGKLDTISSRVEDTNTRIDRLEKQHDLDRTEIQNARTQLAAVVASCPLHGQQLSAAMTAAVEAKQVATRIESSWNDLRPEHLKTRSHSDEYRAVKAAEQNLEGKVALAVVKALNEQRALEVAERATEAKEQRENETHALQVADAKRKRVTWAVGIIASIFGLLTTGGGYALFKQIQTDRQRSREDREATLRALEDRRRVVVVSEVKVPIPEVKRPEKKVPAKQAPAE